jgi:hypothetical protein
MELRTVEGARDISSSEALTADIGGMSLSTLNGTFDSFPLPDVLRLVAASAETGLLHVESDSFTGRVFFVDGEVAYATTRADDHLIDELAKLDHITMEERDALERRAVQLEDVRASRKAVLDVFFSHQVTEVLVRLLSLPDGSFSFDHGVMMAHQVGFRIGVTEALDAAVLRGAEWERINEVVPSVAARFRMAPMIEDEVAVTPERWKLLSLLPTAGTAQDLALALKVFEFQAAGRLAELVRAGLIVETSGDEPGGASPREEIMVETVPERRAEPMSSEEAAELLGSFIALADAPVSEDHHQDSPDVTEKAAEELVGDEPASEADEDDNGGEDLPNRWRRLRNRSGS